MSGTLSTMRELIAHVATGVSLTEEQSVRAFDIIMSGNATPAQIGAFLMALRLRGETVDEVTGAVRAMRSKALMIASPPGSIDIVGTGGDTAGTYNISTATALVTAGCGIPVAKHGNKAVSSKSGAADILTALGVNIEARMDLVCESLETNNIAFLMAPRHHSSMRHVAGPRAELGIRTLFNILGPLSNPANVKRHVIGAYDKNLLRPMAEVLGRLGSDRLWLVHGADGLDELTTTTSTHVVQLVDGTISEFDISPEDLGLPRASATDLKGGTPEENALALRALLDGETGAYRDIVLLNSAAALFVADKTKNLNDARDMAAHSIDSGKARNVLERLIEITNRPLPLPEEDDQETEA